MTIHKRLLAALLTATAMAAPTAAWAAYDQTVVLEGPGSSSIRENQISFATDQGVPVPVQASDDEDDDDSVFFIAFPGESSQAGIITYPGPEGQNRTTAIPAVGPGKTIRLDVGTGRVSVVDSPTKLGDPSFGGLPPVGFQTINLMPELSYTNFGVPNSGYGVVNIGDPDGEAFATHVGGKIDFLTYGATVAFPIGNKFNFSLGYHEGSGSTTDSAFVSGGGEQRGIVYIGPLDTGSSSEPSTGLNAGLLELGILGDTHVRQRAFDAKFGMPFECDKGGMVMPYVRLRYSEIDVRQTVNFSLPELGDSFSSTVHHDFESDTFGVGLGAYYGKFVTENLLVGLNVEGSINFNDRKLNSWQTVDLFGNVDTITVEDNVNDTSFGIGAELDMTYYFTPQLGLNLFGSYYYNDDVGRIDSVLSGNDILAGDTVRIGSRSADEWKVGGRLIFSFGRNF